MALIEHNYLPKELNEIIMPNKEEIINRINLHLENDEMNLLLIGSQLTFKTNAIPLIVKEYYKRLHLTNYTQYILQIDCFNDINLSNTNNDIKIFCKIITQYKKFLIIDNFDIINESNQQYLKIIMDTCKNTFFIFGCENTNKINDIIQTRMTPIYFEDLNTSNYRELIQNISTKEKINFDINELLKYTNITPYFIFNLFNKLKLLGKTEIDDINIYINLINISIMDNYTQLIIKNNIKDATYILFNLFDKGYSLLDIYNFLYEYYKVSHYEYKYKYIEQLCKYIQYIYDGFDNKIMLLFFTNELVDIYNKTNIYEKSNYKI
jgi:DNA polymerase III delta prime subunit